MKNSISFGSRSTAQELRICISGEWGSLNKKDFRLIEEIFTGRYANFTHVIVDLSELVKIEKPALSRLLQAFMHSLTSENLTMEIQHASGQVKAAISTIPLLKAVSQF
jgi:hypothetical protein